MQARAEDFKSLPKTCISDQSLVTYCLPPRVELPSEASHLRGSHIITSHTVQTLLLPSYACLTVHTVHALPQVKYQASTSKGSA